MTGSNLVVVLLVAVAIGCSGGHRPDRRDGGPPDGGSRDAGRLDAPAGDAPSTDGAGRDASPPDDASRACRTNRDCAVGEVCEAGRCGPPAASCCETGVCPPGTACDFRGTCTCVTAGGCCYGAPCPPGERCDFSGSCACIPATGCCAGDPCGPGEMCDWDGSCTCIGCDPPCAADFVCAFGRCIASCAWDGRMCPPDQWCDPERGCVACDPPCGPDAICDRGGRCLASCAWSGEPCPHGLYCDPEVGCVTPACTAEECLWFDPPHHCDPSRGCYDPCTPPEDYAWCEAMGGRCVLGVCVDDACSAGTTTCFYDLDCCGNAFCTDGTYTPWCPPTCEGPPRPVIRSDLCVCGWGGGCIDLAGGFGPIPFPD